MIDEVDKEEVVADCGFKEVVESENRVHDGDQNILNPAPSNGLGVHIYSHSRSDYSSYAPGDDQTKLLKIRLLPEGQLESDQELLIVTVAIDAPTKIGIENNVHDISLGVGQFVTLQHKQNDKGRHTLEISALPNPENNIPITPLKPPSPFEISDGVHRKIDNSEKQPTKATLSRFSINSSLLKSSVQVVTDSHLAKSENKSLSTSMKSYDSFTIPSILTSTITKLSPTEKVGLAFRKFNNAVIVEKVVPESPASRTALLPGYECLFINQHRIRSAQRAAELVRESEKSLTLMVSNAMRPPGTLYTSISVKNQSDRGKDFALGMHFKMKHGLVKLVKVDTNSPITPTSMQVDDFVIAIGGNAIRSVTTAVEVLSNFTDGAAVPILFFSLRLLRVILVEEVVGKEWKKEWSNGYKECIILQPGHNSMIPWTLRFKGDGMCTLLDPLRAFKISSGGNSVSSVPPALQSLVETINHKISSVLSALCGGVVLAALRS